MNKELLFHGANFSASLRFPSRLIKKDFFAFLLEKVYLHKFKYGARKPRIK
jgi:hypothetical protein